MEFSVEKVESGEVVKSGTDYFLVRGEDAKEPSSKVLSSIAEKMLSGKPIKEILKAKKISHLQWVYWTSRSSKVQEMLSVIRRGRVQMAQDQIGAQEFENVMKKDSKVDTMRKFELKQQIFQRQRSIDAPGEEKQTGGGNVVINVGYDEEKLKPIREYYTAKEGDIVEVKSREISKKDRGGEDGRSD